MKKLLLAAGAVFYLSACSTADVQKAASYQSQIAAACSAAMVVAPAVPTVAPWIIGGCGSAEAIAKLASDPAALAWVNSLIDKAKG